MARPSVSRIGGGADVRAAVLVLHGGTQHSTEPVQLGNLSWRRAGVLQRALALRLRGRGVGVWLLRHGQRGWNDPSAPAPVPDARWALDQVRAEADVPVVVVGHSMGARTGARVADDPSVRGLVALAPWFPPGEPVAGLADKRLVVAHGRADRITSYAASRDFVARSRRVARSAEFHDMGDVGHYLLRRARSWHDLAAASALRVLGLD